MYNKIALKTFETDFFECIIMLENNTIYEILGQVDFFTNLSVKILKNTCFFEIYFLTWFIEFVVYL